MVTYALMRKTDKSTAASVEEWQLAEVQLGIADLDASYHVSHDLQKSYDAAIEEYRRALVIDPSLSDPRKNPQVVNNENMVAVRLKIYQNQAGSLGLPLLQMQKPTPAVKSEPVKN